MYPPKKIVIPEWSLPSYSRRNEIPEVIALVRIRREILAVERQSGIVLYWCKHRVSFIFFSSCCCCTLSWYLHGCLTFIFTFLSFFFLLLLSLLFSSLFSLFFCHTYFFCFFFFLQIRTVAITLVDILERRWRGKFFQNIVVRHGRKKLLISRWSNHMMWRNSVM